MNSTYQDIVSGLSADPFAVLGRHSAGKKTVLRCFMPGADTVEVLTPRGKKPVIELSRVDAAGIFEGEIAPS